MADLPERTRSMPARPRTGWQAWEATAGYVASRHSPDATLKIEIYPLGGVVGWAAAFSWGKHQESIRDRVSFGDALTALWQRIEAFHPDLMETPEAQTRRPIAYPDDEWLDQATLDVVSRLVSITETAFGSEWQLVIVYRPVETATDRLQTRLIAQNGETTLGGRGATLRDACRALFTNAAVRFRQFVLKS